MLTAEKLNRRFTTDTLTPGTRMLALFFFIINIPPLVLGLMTVIGIPIMIPGIILFVLYGRMAFNKAKIGEGIGAWKGTMLYNGAGIAWYVWMITDRGFPDGGAWTVMLIPLFGFAIGALGYRMLREKNNHPATV